MFQRIKTDPAATNLAAKVRGPPWRIEARVFLHQSLKRTSMCTGFLPIHLITGTGWACKPYRSGFPSVTHNMHACGQAMPRIFGNARKFYLRTFSYNLRHCAHLPHNICSVPTKVGGLETKTDDQQFSKSTGLQKRDPNPTHQGTCWTHHRHHQWSCHLDHNFGGTLYRFGWEPRYLFSNVLPIGGLLQVWYCWATWDKGNCLLQYL